MVWRLILNEFKSRARQIGEEQGFSCEPWFQGTGWLKPYTRNRSEHIVEFSGSINCLAYIKVRSEKPYTWGLTANQIRKFKQSGKDWIVVLLYETPDTGYLLSADDVARNSPAWSIKQGDYKVNRGNIDYCKPFISIDQLFQRLHQTLQYK